MLEDRVQKELGEKLDGYMEAIKMMPAEGKCTEVDFLIDSSTDSLVRQFIAIHLYSSYMNSKVMGDEAVAIHITDNWFVPGKIKMQSELDLMNAKIFADFNRQSLIGMKAPELMDGVFGDRPTVLFFYSADCPRCLMETMLFKSLFKDNEYPIDIAAFYTGDDQDEWSGYIRKNLSFGFDTIRVNHFWDPDMNTDFQKKYGLLQTPGIFLVDTDGIIIGRKLDGFALRQLLDGIFNDSPTSYGDDEADKFFRSLAAQSIREAKEKNNNLAKGSKDKLVEKLNEEATLTYNALTGMADYLAKSSGYGIRNKKFFKQTIGDYLYSICRIQNEGYKQAALHIIDTYIEGNDCWDTTVDTLQILDYADFLKDMMNKPTYGAKLPKVKLDYSLISRRTSKKAHGRLDKIAKNALVIFHTDGCPICTDQIEAATELMMEGLTKKVIIDINIDEFLNGCSDNASLLFENLDLSTLPFIVVTDSRGRVIHKYTDLITLGLTD